MFRFSAEPKRCTSVAAPVEPVARVSPARCSSKPEIVRYTSPSTCVSAAGFVASRQRSA
jgi:hypothetical protein